ncbi:MAG: hypothetical protein C4583_16805 [Anaerolineaceae bacterium]|nr:MAG: hypothetical protein C4583_16805 [Anaerolineaceae bacterium]
MKKNLFIVLVAMILLSACGGPAATPNALEPRATPTVAYQVVGSTKNTFMVVVDPKSRADREGLQKLGDYLCSDMPNCRVWFWDDINKADTSYPLDPDKEETLIAYYTFSFAEWKSELKVYTLGDER